MEQKERIKLKRRKMIGITLLFLILGFGLIGFSLYQAFSFYELSHAEAANLSELASQNNLQEGQHVKIECNRLPVYIRAPKTEGHDLYFVTDIHGQRYIADITDKTFSGIADKIYEGEGEYPYEIKGLMVNIDDTVKQYAIANGDEVFDKYIGEELTSENFSEYLGDFYIQEPYAGEYSADISKILCYLGILLLIIALLYCLPYIIRISKGNFGIYDEKKMIQALAEYAPRGETVRAGVCGVGIRTEIHQAFSKCIYDGDRLIPEKDGTAIEVVKRKEAKHNLYLGITEHNLVFAECAEYKHAYSFRELENPVGMSLREIDAALPIEEICNYFPLSEVNGCAVKKALYGNVRCTITMKNDSVIKINIPKSLEPGMPHQAEYRNAIIQRLTGSEF